jgi:hypothetical protein
MRVMPRRRSIIAHHLILPLYGHWAPNDPRGKLAVLHYHVVATTPVGASSSQTMLLLPGLK